MPGIKSLFSGKTDYMVKVTDGVKAKSYPIREIIGYNEGYALRYKDGNGLLDVVYMSREFRPVEEDGKLWVGKRLGNNSACELDFACDVMGPSTDKDCPGDDLSSVVRTDGLAIGYRTLYESKIPWKWIIIIGIVAVVIMAIFYFKSRGGA